MSSSQCIFCKIVNGEIPAQKLYEDDSFVCIRDIHPQAPTHLLVLPREHITSLMTAFPEAGGAAPIELIGRMFEVSVRLARQVGLHKGYRNIINTGSEGGQTVQHLHLHLLGGKTLSEEMG